MKRLNILELHRKMNEQNEKKSVCYDKVLELCHKRIISNTEKNKTSLMFDFPEYIVGMPLFDLNMCIEHVYKHLIIDGFCVHYHFPKGLYISWDLEDIKRFKTEQRRHTPLTALLPQQNTQLVNTHILQAPHMQQQSQTQIYKQAPGVHPAISSHIIPQPQTFSHTYPQTTVLKGEDDVIKPKQQLPQMIPSVNQNAQTNYTPPESQNNLQIVTHPTHMQSQNPMQNQIPTQIAPSQIPSQAQNQIQNIIYGGGLDLPSPLLPQAPPRSFQSAPKDPLKYDPFDIWNSSGTNGKSDTEAMKQMLVSNIGSSNKKKVFNYKPSGKLSLNI